MVELLSSPGFAGRSIGTPEAAATAGFLAGVLMAAGVPPAGTEGYFQRVPVVARRAQGARGSLTLGDSQVAELGRDLAISTGIDAPTTLTAPLVVVRWSSATETLPEDVPFAALAGAIVIVERLGNPAEMVPAAATAALTRLNRAGPAVVLSVTQDLVGLLEEEAGDADAYADPGWRFVLADDAGGGGIGGQIDADLVATIAGAPPDPASLKAAQITLLHDPATLELGFDAFQRRAFDELNVIARIPGRDPSAKAVLLTAHYDHLGIVDGVLHPGADDNLSGVAVIQEAARQLAADPPAADIEIAFFTGEEHGLLGSRAFAAAALPRAADDYAALFNIDAIGRPQADRPEFANTIFASGLGCWPTIDRAVAAGAEASGLDLVELADEPSLAMLDASCDALAAGTGGPPSDQMPLLTAGVPGLLLTGGLNADYHGPGDTPDKVDFDRLARVVDFVVAAVRAIPEE